MPNTDTMDQLANWLKLQPTDRVILAYLAARRELESRGTDEDWIAEYIKILE